MSDIGIDRFEIASTHPEAGGGPSDAGLRITVVHTTMEATVVALQRAAELSARLSARISLIAPQVVPFPLPLSEPPVVRDFSESALRSLAGHCPAGASVTIVLGRDLTEAVRTSLSPNSLVFLGARRGWWPTRERRLAGRLKKAGHEVILVEAK